MASSSSSPSDDEQLQHQKAKLISEQQKLQKEIQRLKLQADGHEHDLQVAKAAFNFAESTIINRTKKLATMFGGLLQSDEELFERIKGLMQQIEEDEATAAELRLEIKRCKETHTKGDSTLEDAQILVKRQKQATRDKAVEKQSLQEKLAELSATANEVQAERATMHDAIAPIARLIACSTNDPGFFPKLQDRVSRLTPEIQQLFGALADAVDIPRPVEGGFDIPRFLDSVAFKYEKLAHASQLTEEVENTVQEKLRECQRQIARKQAKVRKLQASLRASETELAAQDAAQVEATRNHQRLQNERLMGMKQAEQRTLRSTAEAMGIKHPLRRSATEIGAALADELETQIALLQRAREARDQRNAEFAERLNQGIHVVEKATKVISHSNRKLLRVIQTADL
jgi:hypothetical protein